MKDLSRIAIETAHTTSSGALTASTGQDLSGKGFVGLVPREMALTVLRANAPATLDWLEPSSEGSTRVLPLIAATKDGFRLGATEYP